MPKVSSRITSALVLRAVHDTLWPFMPQTVQNQGSSKPVIVLLGGPGSGKGTHGLAVASALGYEHLSSGGHLRDHIRRATPLGTQATKFIENGQLVPDDLVTKLIQTLL